jgi:hypothetical protein
VINGLCSHTKTRPGILVTQEVMAEEGNDALETQQRRSRDAEAKVNVLIIEDFALDADFRYIIQSGEGDWLAYAGEELVEVKYCSRTAQHSTHNTTTTETLRTSRTTSWGAWHSNAFTQVGPCSSHPHPSPSLPFPSHPSMPAVESVLHPSNKIPIPPKSDALVADKRGKGQGMDR